MSRDISRLITTHMVTKLIVQMLNIPFSSCCIFRILFSLMLDDLIQIKSHLGLNGLCIHMGLVQVSPHQLSGSLGVRRKCNIPNPLEVRAGGSIQSRKSSKATPIASCDNPSQIVFSKHVVHQWSSRVTLHQEGKKRKRSLKLAVYIRRYSCFSYMKVLHFNSLSPLMQQNHIRSPGLVYTT